MFSDLYSGADDLFPNTDNKELVRTPSFAFQDD